jgi:hypothetical protein
MFSLVVFAIVTGGALAALQGAQQLSEESRSRLVAMDAARSVLEAMKDPNLDLDQILGLNTAVALPGGSVTIDSVPTDNLDTVTSAIFTVYVYWNPKGSTANCNRASNTGNPVINGCRSVRFTTIRSANFNA